MTRVALRVILFGICLFMVGNAVAADVTEQKDVPKAAPAIRDNAQQDKPPDEIQGQYIARLRRISADLLTQHSAFSKNYMVITFIQERMSSELEWGHGSIPSHLLKNLQDLSAEKTNIETRIKVLEEEKKELRSNALSFYNDKIPEWLSQRWAAEEKQYSDSVDEIYLQLQWSLRKSNEIEDERQRSDLMREYYRQRKQGSRE
jgi:hypothetical protein